ncbi:MAG TPA: preprotein translocase subunit SecB, partial [Syntrophomonadaceae bacterium]|nr:preprotein translocase subunit SecB [Syntrophomonadaceae bacterium]
MKDKDIMADFQFLGHRVSKLVLDTRLVEEKGPSNVSFDFDYEVMELLEEDNRFLGIIQLIVQVKAKIKNKVLFKIDLKMEGAFAGNAEKLGHQRFTDMLEMNGLITLLHISRAYLLSVTAQSGINPPVKL